jgi:putative salt-induced outer membrane protein YdiY
MSATHPPPPAHRNHHCRNVWWLTLVVVAFASTPPLSAKRKDDRIVLANGDHLIGEIKQLAHGALHFKTNYVVDELLVDWLRVVELDSQDLFRVMVKDGRNLTGQMTRHVNGGVTVTSAVGTVTSLQWTDVIAFAPVETSVWSQFAGNIDSGFSYTSDNNQTQLSVSGSVGYAADRWAFDLSGSSTSSRQSGADGTNRNTARLTTQFTLVPKWFAMSLVELLNSHQQDLDLRTTLGGGFGRLLIETDLTDLTVFGGLVYTHERYAASADASQQPPDPANNLEALVSARFSLYRFKTTDVETNVTVYPSLTTPGRVRLNLAPTLNIEIAHNLHWSFTLYENYDSQPPVSANKNDFGVTNSIGWKF